MGRPLPQSADVIALVIGALGKLDDDDRARALRAIAAYFDFTLSDPSSAASRPSPEPAAPFSMDRSPSPKEFLHEKQPRTDVERVACLAYYLAHYRDMPHFKTIDLTKLNTEAAQLKFSNASVATANAASAGYLAPAGKGKRQLTAAAERFVEELPDRAGAREIMAAARKSSPRKPSSRGTKR